jgi:hypothetical protein
LETVADCSYLGIVFSKPSSFKIAKKKKLVNKGIILDWLNTLDVITDAQFSFRPSFGTVDAAII